VKKGVSITVDEKILRKAKREAQKHNRSLSGYINAIIAERLGGKNAALLRDQTRRPSSSVGRG